MKKLDKKNVLIIGDTHCKLSSCINTFIPINKSHIFCSSKCGNSFRNHLNKAKLCKKLYQKSKSGKDTKRKYLQTDKGKIASRRNSKTYLQTPTGKIKRVEYLKSKQGKLNHLLGSEKYKQQYPERDKAVSLANRKLPKGNCEVENCNIIGEKHHDDYSKPLEVRYLCMKHHREFHKAVKSV